MDATDLISPLGPPAPAATALAVLAEPVRRWFVERFGRPTAAQCLAWPALAAGHNLLLCAPTGSGKTLAAFLPILSRLLDEPPASGIRCVYVTPLKALGNDVRKNLRSALREIRAGLPAGQGTPRLGLRTGDTSARLRRRLRLEPPDILLTTPESLAVLLSQAFYRGLLAAARWVVVDEAHALAGNKRGADLALSIERLTDWAGGRLQRIGLSATCAPVAEVGRFLVGAGRSCAVARVAEEGPLHFALEPLPESAPFLPRLLDRLEPELLANRSTIVFTNTRSLAERLTWGLKRRFPEWEAEVAVHHSALAASRRRGVERRLKQGRLRAVITSTSLELGIDVGTVDGVVLVHPPGGVARLWQRIGRAGHAPGRPRRALVLTTGSAELLEAAVTAASGLAAQLEPLAMLSHPLDVLCQQLLGMAAAGPWTPDEAFALVRRAAPYRALARADFDACLAYLCGQHADGRDWLPARLRRQGDALVIRDERTARLLRRNLGTILTEGPRTVRLAGADGAREPGPVIGEVEEPFADRLQAGDRFLLDGRCLECRQAPGPEVLVQEVAGRPVVPRWTGEGWPLAPDLARRLYLLRVQAAEALREGEQALLRLLRRDYALDEPAAEALAEFFRQQELVSEIPDATTCLIEVVRGEGVAEYYVHTPLNRPANDALARVLVRRLARDRGKSATSLVADLGFALYLGGGTELMSDDFQALLRASAFDADLAEAVADGPTLRERFRRVALTGLMLLRQPLGSKRRVGGPDWAERRLYDQVRAAEPDFVLLRQAEREVWEGLDADSARAFLEELPRRTLRCRRLSALSPFVEGWTQQTAGAFGSVDDPAETLRQLHAALNL